MAEQTESFGSVSQPYLTCISCRLQFGSVAAQKDHYKTEFHRFNLKRKVAGLAPVNEEAFLKRLGEHASKVAVGEKYLATCTICSKTYNTEKGYEQHILSNKHKERAAVVLEEKGELPGPERTLKKIEMPKAQPPTRPDSEEAKSSQNAESAEADEENDFSEYEREKLRNAVILALTDCIFCKHQSPDIQGNLDHMTRVHSFFIPDIEYLVDLEGFLRYIGEKVSVGNICLFCNGKGRSFHSLEAIRSHMVEKGHCKILYEEDTAEEFADYYDFSPSYPVDDDSAPAGLIEGAPEGEEGDNEEWEDVDEDAEDEEDDFEEIVGKWKESIRIADTQELILADGKRLGHRSLMVYYKQKPKVKDTRYDAIIRDLMAQYQKMGALATQTWRKKTYNEVSFEGRRRENKEALRVGMKNNNQKHHREQVMY